MPLAHRRRGGCTGACRYGFRDQPGPGTYSSDASPKAAGWPIIHGRFDGNPFDRPGRRRQPGPTAGTTATSRRMPSGPAGHLRRACAALVRRGCRMLPGIHHPKRRHRQERARRRRPHPGQGAGRRNDGGLPRRTAHTVHTDHRIHGVPIVPVTDRGRGGRRCQASHPSSVRPRRAFYRVEHSVGRDSVAHAFGMSTTPLRWPGTGATPRIE